MVKKKPMITRHPKDLKKHDVKRLLGIGAFLIGVVFLFESLGTMVILDSITGLSQTSLSIAWGYATIKLIAGLLAIAGGLVYYVAE